MRRPPPSNSRPPAHRSTALNASGNDSAVPWIERVLVLIALSILSISGAILTDFVIFKYSYGESFRTPGTLLLPLVNLGLKGIGGGIVTGFLFIICVDSLCYIVVLFVAFSAFKRFRRRNPK